MLLSAGLDSELAEAKTLTGPADVTTGVVAPDSPVFYQINLGSNDHLVAKVQAPGSVTRLSLLDDQGDVLVQSDGQAVNHSNDLIDQDLPAGTYYLEVEGLEGPASYTMTMGQTADSAPYQPTLLNLPQSEASPLAPPILLGFGLSPPAASLEAPPPPASSGAVSSPTAPTPTVPGSTASGSSSPPAAGLFSEDLSVVPATTFGIFVGGGALDLAAPDGIHPGLGDGTFGPAMAPLPIAAQPADVTAMAAADLGGRGPLDLVVASYSSSVGQLQVLLGKGDGTFVAEPPIDLGALHPSKLAVGDFDGNGDLGVAVAGTVDNRLGDGRLDVLSGDGAGGFERPFVMRLGANFDPISLVAGDFNGDGRNDLAVEGYDVPSDFETYDCLVRVLLTNKDGTFAPPATAPTPISIDLGLSAYGGMVAGDFNEDGRLDLAIAGSDYVVTLPGLGDGSFGAPTKIVVGATDLTTIAAGDFTGDGHLDIAVGGTDGGVSPNSSLVEVLLGKGAMQFTPARTAALLDFESESLSPGDFNGDGRIDLGVVGMETPLSGASTACFQVLPGDGDGTFVARQSADAADFGFEGSG